jgi:hypothetical protein
MKSELISGGGMMKNLKIFSSHSGDGGLVEVCEFAMAGVGEEDEDGEKEDDTNGAAA